MTLLFYPQSGLCMLFDHCPCQVSDCMTTDHNSGYTTLSSISLILFFKESKLHVIILHYYCLLLFPCLLCTCLKGTLHSNTVFWDSSFNNLKIIFRIALSCNETSLSFINSFRNYKADYEKYSFVLFAYWLKSINIILRFAL